MRTPPESAILLFDNGYGVSMQRSSFHYSTDTSHEVAVVHRVNAEKNHRVCHFAAKGTLVPDGVLGYQRATEVADLIAAVRALKPVAYCNHVSERDYK